MCEREKENVREEVADKDGGYGMATSDKACTKYEESTWL